MMDYYQIAEAVLTEGSDEEGVVGKFLFRVREAATTEALPDKVEERSGLVGRPRLVAIKALPGPTYPLDAWSQEVKCDAVTVAYRNLVGYAGDGMGIFELPDPKEFEGKPVRFMLLTKEEHDEILNLLHQYITTDIDDYRDTPLLGALYPLEMREDSPLSEWNAKAKAFHEAKREESQSSFKEREKKISEEIQRLRQFADVLESLGLKVKREEGEEKDPFLLDQTHPCLSLDVEYRGKVYRFRELPENPEELLKALQENMEAWKVLIQERLPYLQGEKPVVWVKDWEGRLEKGTNLKVPKNLLPHVIGREGRRIKAISNFIGRRIQVIEIPEIYLPKDWKIGFVNPPSQIPKGWERFETQRVEAW